ncbi:unnamed protein product [Musa acuminata subsp. malaccensis]|uniref:(wild Malaysian banana) hypothetical protein n=1 Tax=Musa acuminata subsp. malaccensis TaxID=214687 RepID=A0A804I4B3_MUSAM|nr:PREDICTED: probable receptor-like protein kinase At5g20050 [Musa acuminata subsp. malaccensis]CAG1862467.1 unnamed protein product [Musa acuminata subsp. malaccensis]
MEPKKAKLVACVGIGCLLVLLVIVFSRVEPSKDFLTVAAIGLAVVLVITLWLLVHYIILNRRRTSALHRLSNEGQELRFQYSFFRKVAGLPTKFSLKELDAATDNFQALIGRGGSGAVFKGILDNGTPVAVKRIEGAEYGEKEFRAEISAIASVQHVNLVRLLGYCLVPGGGPCFLVYEFIENGSLDGWIFSSAREHRARRGQCLPWPLRYQVAIDVARALAYLHHDCRARVLHLDIKPENILLDTGFRGVVADFGLSKLMSRDQSRIVASVRGTRGYLAPEWLLGSGISERSDIYSYGMVLLELVGGRRNVRVVDPTADAEQRKWSYFPKIVMEKAREGRVMEVVDERLERVDERQVTTMVNVALWCIQEQPELRPSMARVFDMLEGRLAVGAPPETEMIVVDLLSIMDEDQTSAAATSSSCSTFGPRNEASVGGQSEGPHATYSSYSAMSQLSGR